MDNRGQTLYVYDSICPKYVKEHQIANRYGAEYKRRNPGKKRAPYVREFETASTKKKQGGVFQNLWRFAVKKIGEGADKIDTKLKDPTVVKKVGKYRHRIGTVILLAAVVIVFLIVIYRTVFVVTHVDVNGTDAYTAEDICLAAEIEKGDGLYSFAAGDAENAVTFSCPGLKSATVKRTVPNKVSITVNDDVAVWQTVIWGDRVTLSAGLRVLDTLPDNDDCDLPTLLLPAVRYSVAGRTLEFANSKDDRYIRSVLNALLESPLNGRTGKVDLTNSYNTTLTVDGRYLMKLGTEEDCDLKLKMGYKTITSSDFDASSKARIDLTTTERAIVEYDHSLIVD